ncbi:hypothetical protein BS78_03G074200 [Paspalum vaginatum]|nr:hypothetical protein BS78_03G074200 [Paspalum vaginatum]
MTPDARESNETDRAVTDSASPHRQGGGAWVAAQRRGCSTSGTHRCAAQFRGESDSDRCRGRSMSSRGTHAVSLPALGENNLPLASSPATEDFVHLGEFAAYDKRNHGNTSTSQHISVHGTHGQALKVRGTHSY